MLVDSVGRDSLEICGERGWCSVSESVSSLCQVLGCCTQEGGRGSESGGEEEGLGGEEGS